MEAATLTRGTLSVTMPRAWLSQMLAHAQSEPFGVAATLTPELARILLEKNACNRPLREATVGHYALLIEDGRWTLNGEAIILSLTGDLNTGQHRCHAVIKADKPITTLFTFGVTRESRTTTDSGRAKTPGDRLAMLQVEDGRTVAAVAGLVWQLQKFGEVPLGNNLRDARPSAPVLDEISLQWEKTIRASIEAISKRGSGKIASYPVLVFTHLLFSQGDPTAATSFFEKLVEGVGLAGDDPIFAARERLMEERLRGGRVGARKSCEIIIRAWNAHRRAQKAKFIRVNGSWPEISV